MGDMADQLEQGLWDWDYECPACFASVQYEDDLCDECLEAVRRGELILCPNCEEPMKGKVCVCGATLKETSDAK